MTQLAAHLHLHGMSLSRPPTTGGTVPKRSDASLGQLSDKFVSVMRVHARLGSVDDGAPLQAVFGQLPGALGAGLARRVLLLGILACRDQLDARAMAAFNDLVPIPDAKAAHGHENLSLTSLPRVLQVATVQWLPLLALLAVERTSRAMMHIARDEHAVENVSRVPGGCSPEAQDNVALSSRRLLHGRLHGARHPPRHGVPVRRCLPPEFATAWLSGSPPFHPGGRPRPAPLAADPVPARRAPQQRTGDSPSLTPPAAQHFDVHRNAPSAACVTS